MSVPGLESVTWVVKVNSQSAGAWSMEDWSALERRLTSRLAGFRHDRDRLHCISHEARRVLKCFSTNFFLVTRFLPKPKREQVELVYAAVRYPDEVVDTFPITSGEREHQLDTWLAAYEHALQLATLGEALQLGLPPFCCAFVHLVQSLAIPPDHYRAFLAAMRRDVTPRPFASLQELIDDYVYGSAVVVGYFLSYVYGAAAGAKLADTLEVSRKLGIALQLTNFVRDTSGDLRCNRVYLPLEMLGMSDLKGLDLNIQCHQQAIAAARRELASHAAVLYTEAAAGLKTFASDSRVAIRACIDVYAGLNQRLLLRANEMRTRESLPTIDKFKALPASKYWRLPLAFAGWL